ASSRSVRWPHCLRRAAGPAESDAGERCSPRLYSAKRSISRSASRLAFSRAVHGLVSTTSQSAGRPSETDSVKASRRSPSLIAHDLRELADRTPHALPHGVAARAIRHGRDLVVAEVQLEAQVQEQALFLTQLALRSLVPLQEIGADRVVERRRRGVREVLR